MTKGHDFYFVNVFRGEVWVNFSFMLVTISQFWPVICVLTLQAVTTCTEYVECKQLSNQSPSLSLFMPSYLHTLTLLLYLYVKLMKLPLLVTFMKDSHNAWHILSV